MERDGDDTAGTPEHNLHVDRLFDAPHPSGEDRYAIYASTRRSRWRIAETSLDGIGLTLRTLHDEGQIDNTIRVSILDRETREWLVKGGV